MARQKIDKVVLVFDKPEMCRDCPCFDSVSFEPYCYAADRGFDDSEKALIKNGKRYKPLFCPLVDMPKYKPFFWSDDSYEAGWNDALDAVGGSK